MGASYDSFGDLGLAVDGLPTGFVKGVNDPGFTGLHRLEYGLWHGQPAAELLPVTNVLAKNVATVQKNLTSDDLAGDPTQLPLRVHEIIEDALRDHLSGIDDEGGNAAYAQTWADTQVDRVVLGDESALINDRDPGLVATAQSELSRARHGAAGDQDQRRPVAVAHRGLARPAPARGRGHRGAARDARGRSRPAGSPAHALIPAPPGSQTHRFSAPAAPGWQQPQEISS